ncbi:saccharopine dehydrogenase family protein [Leucobacter komagatae]|uniref:saccharopine dehydrogenase family protein n=1 Tax=Leucobacter komagatae TaxID=55969 RepID=UPI0011523F33|nr:saccharopine dehydrogenase NADP-binding domain-containing protein [Leucobacter komagatae]
MAGGALVSGGRVLVIGGVGQIGRHAVRLLGTFPEVQSVTIGDVDTTRAELLAAELGDRGSMVRLDATDRAQLDLALAESDLVLNALGPFNRFGLPILTAAIENGVPYVDICDDWEATELFLALDHHARAAGVTAIIGAGLSPGITNLLAVLAARGYESVDRLLTSWSLSGASVEFEEAYDGHRPPGSAAMYHWIEQATGTIRVWRDGALADVPPLERLVVRYPELGEAPVHTLGHPEPITLPPVIGGVRESLNVMTGPEWVFDALRDTADRVNSGELTIAGGVERMANNTPPETREERLRLPSVWAMAEGSKDGRKVATAVRMAALPAHRMGGSTGYPAAIAALLVLRGDITETGVLPPERAIHPERFFAELGRVTTPAVASVDDLVIIEEEALA